jgi:hypothetical protein
MTRIPDKCRLLHTPYRPPRLHVGDRADCLMRGTVVITSWTDARVYWPRCRPLEGKSHPSLLLDDELARAVRTEAAAAVCFWWGVSHGVVQRWRRALGVNRINNPRTHQLMLEACQAGADAIKAKEWTEEEQKAKREAAKTLNLARHLRPRYRGDEWTEAEIKLLGKLPDAEVAARIGRTVEAVRVKRTRAGLPTAKDQRQRRGKKS